MGFRRFVGLLALVAAALAAYGAYAPASVEKWSPAAGAYEQPGMDLRIKKRNAFAIALPLCPR